MSVHFSFWSGHLVLKRLVGCVLILAAATGCQSNKTAFQMDSDRKAPILGLRLQPKETATQTTGIRRVNADSKGSEKDSKVQNIDRTEATADNSKWKKFLGHFGHPKRIPLPRTDLLSDETLIGETQSPESALQGF